MACRVSRSNLTACDFQCHLIELWHGSWLRIHVDQFIGISIGIDRIVGISFGSLGIIGFGVDMIKAKALFIALGKIRVRNVILAVTDKVCTILSDRLGTGRARKACDISYWTVE